jgi:hypothetical protein
MTIQTSFLQTQIVSAFEVVMFDLGNSSWQNIKQWNINGKNKKGTNILKMVKLQKSEVRFVWFFILEARQEEDEGNSKQQNLGWFFSGHYTKIGDTIGPKSFRNVLGECWA